MQLSELPEDPEPSSSLGPCILRIIRLQLLASLAGCALIFLNYYYRNAQLNKSSSSFFLLHEIGLCLAAGLLMASENTAMQSISEVHCNAISFDYYGIEIVKLKSKRPSAKQATD